MNELYLFAFAVFAVCMANAFICICRLNSMGRGVLIRVRVEYAALLTGNLGCAFAPWIGEWPGWTVLGICIAILISLIASSRAWSKDTPPAAASEVRELRHLDGRPL